jgi:hypothetical protein
MSTTSTVRGGAITRVYAGKTLFEWAGIAAGVLLIAFGISALTLSWNGRQTVRDSLRAERIVGTAAMTPRRARADAAVFPSARIDVPDCAVDGVTVDTGARARCFASYMRVHVLESTGGRTYSQLPLYATEDRKGTDDANRALMAADGEPVDYPGRTLWITETALSTALNSSYLAEQVANFGLVVGLALLLSGIGFVVIAGKGLGRAAA